MGPEHEAGALTDDAPLQVILGVFSSSKRAKSVRVKLRESERLDAIAIVGLASIARDDDGRLELVEARSGSGRLEHGVGSWPGILRLVWGPSPARLQGLAAALPPGSSAIAALIEHRWVGEVHALLEEAGSEAVEDALKAEIAAVLAEGRDVLLTAGAATWRAG